MPASVAIEVEGLDDLRRTLRRIGADDMRKALRQANKRAAEMVVRRAMPDVPVLTGALRRSVKALAGERDARAQAGSARVRHAQAIHWGVGPRSGQRGPHNIPRRPFLWEAADRMRRELADVYLEEVDEILRALRP